MVTVELVFGILIVSVMVTVFGWAILLFGVQVSCIDSAAAIARQAARGDDQAVAAAKSRMPRGATVQVTRDAQQVHVTVRVDSRPLDFVPAVQLHAEATALKEPGA
jgi:hypothetical protein